MGFERSYQIKILTKQLNKLYYSTINQIKLDPWFLTGFTDAEGCFSISIRFDPRLKNNWRILPVFIIKLHPKDHKLLDLIKNSFGVGKIRYYENKSVQYVVESFKDLQEIINHFDKYPLVTAKLSDFLLFKECFEIIKNKEHLTKEGMLKLIGLKNSINKGLSNKLIKAFPNFVPANRPPFVFKGIINPFWISGFTSGDGSFNINVNKQKQSVMLKFSINLHIRDKEVLIGIYNYLHNIVNNKQDIKNIYTLEQSAALQIQKLSEVIDLIIPFFEKYPILGIKSQDFLDWKEVAYMVKNNSI